MIYSFIAVFGYWHAQYVFIYVNFLASGVLRMRAIHIGVFVLRISIGFGFGAILRVLALYD
jgi:hypothetical protein